MNELLSIEFDAESFVKNVDEAIKRLDGLDAKMKDVADATKQVSFMKPITEINKLKTLMSQGSTFEGFDQIFENFDKNVPKIKQYLEELKKSMKAASNPEEMKSLKAIIDQTERAIAEATDTTKKFGAETQKAGEKQVALRTQIKLNREELHKLEKQGKENSKEYVKLKNATSDLIDSQKDLSGALNKLSSDTYKVDLGVEGIQVGIGAYQTYIGVLGLVGGENEDLQKTLTKLMAVQQVASGVQQIATFLTNKEGLALELKTMWTNLSTVATEGATVAQRAFNTAMLATGVGALVIGLGLLVANWESVSRAISGTTERQELQNDVSKKASESASKEIAHLKILSTTAQNHALSTEKRTQAVNELQEMYPAYFGNLSKEKILNGDITKEVNLLTKALIAKSKVQAYEEKLVDLYKQRFDLIQKERELNQKGGSMDPITNLFRVYKKSELISEAKKLGSDIGFVLSEIEKEIGATDKLNPFGNDDKEKKEKKKKEAKLFYMDASKLQSEEYKKAMEEAKKYFDNLSETTDKADKDLKQLKIENIKDSIEKELAQLELSHELQGKALDKAIQENKTKLLDFASIHPEQYDEILVQIAQFEQTANAIRKEAEFKYQNDKLEINKKYLELQLNQLKANVERINSEDAKDGAEEVLKQAQRYANREISLEEYNINVVKIEKKYREKRLQDSIIENDAQINLLRDKLKTASGVEATELEAKINNLEADKAKAENELIDKKAINFKDTLMYKIFGIDPDDPNGKAKIESIQNSMKSIINSTISILKEQARQEVANYDQAVTLQKSRVTDAQKLAEAGNAEYLQMEEERLIELEKKREDAARRQLEIDSAVQASQILVAIAGGVAQIAQGGPAGVIAGIATMAAAAASGFALLNSLQAARPTFFDGTEALGISDNAKPTYSTGKDDYLVRAHLGERIVPTAINNMLKGVSNEDLPKLVALGRERWDSGMNYSIPTVANENNELKKKLDRLAELTEVQNKMLDKLGISVNLDEDGFSASLSKYNLRQQKIKNA